jgi:hypothetical protein
MSMGATNMKQSNQIQRIRELQIGFFADLLPLSNGTNGEGYYQ